MLQYIEKYFRQPTSTLFYYLSWRSTMTSILTFNTTLIILKAYRPLLWRQKINKILSVQLLASYISANIFIWPSWGETETEAGIVNIYFLF